jgi:hypothetical protein
MTVVLYILAAIGLLVIVVPFIFGLFGGARLLPDKKGHKLFKEIEKKLNEEASLLKFRNDFEKLQEVKAQLLWLKTLDEINSRDTLGEKRTENQSEYLSNLTETDLQYPIKFQYLNFNHYPFAQEIISGYRKVLAENEYSFYKPNQILPYPKKLIYKAILFVTDFIEQDTPIYEIFKKEEQRDNLASIKSFLYLSFINDAKQTLPKQGMENFKIGKEILASHPDENINESDLIDWK